MRTARDSTSRISFVVSFIGNLVFILLVATGCSRRTWMMTVVIVVVMVMRMWIMLSDSLTTPSFLFGWTTDRLPLFLIPSTQAFAAKHQVFVVYYYWFHPPLFLQLGLSRVCVRQVVMQGFVAMVMRRRWSSSNHLERGWVMRLRVRGVLRWFIMRRRARRTRLLVWWFVATLRCRSASWFSVVVRYTRITSRHERWKLRAGL